MDGCHSKAPRIEPIWDPQILTWFSTTKLKPFVDTPTSIHIKHLSLSENRWKGDPAARAPANASTFAVTIVIGTPSAIKLGVNWPVKLNAMASGLRPAAVRVLPLGLETALNSSKSCTIPPGGTQQAPSSSLMWRRAVTPSSTLLQFDVEASSHCSPPHQTGGGWG